MPASLGLRSRASTESRSNPAALGYAIARTRPNTHTEPILDRPAQTRAASATCQPGQAPVHKVTGLLGCYFSFRLVSGDQDVLHSGTRIREAGTLLPVEYGLQLKAPWRQHLCGSPRSWAWCDCALTDKFASLGGFLNAFVFACLSGVTFPTTGFLAGFAW